MILFLNFIHCLAWKCQFFFDISLTGLLCPFLFKSVHHSGGLIRSTKGCHIHGQHSKEKENPTIVGRDTGCVTQQVLPLRGVNIWARSRKKTETSLHSRFGARMVIEINTLKEINSNGGEIYLVCISLLDLFMISNIHVISLLFPLLPLSLSSRGCSLCSSKLLLQLQQQLPFSIPQALLRLSCFHLSYLSDKPNWVQTNIIMM